MLKLLRMKKILLALLLIPSLAFATTNNRVVIFTHAWNGGMSMPSRKLGCLFTALERGHWDYDIIDVSVKKWGGSGIDDGQWFADRYKAAIVPYLSTNAFGITGGGFGSNFQNNLNQARTAFGPLGGRWPIPVFVLAENLTPSVATDDTTANNFICGITNASPAGSYPIPNETNGGTWRFRQLCRIKNGIDTLYTQPRAFACRPSSFPFAGSIAALAWGDTLGFGGASGCGGTDTSMTAWVWKPRPDKAGVYYFLFEDDFGSTQCNATPFMLQYLATITSAKPQLKIRVPLVEHSSYPASLTPTRKNNLLALHNRLNSLGVKRMICVEANNYALSYDPDIIAKMREDVNTYGNLWQTFTDSQYYLTTDTTNFRIKLNSEIITCTAPDSFGLNKSKYNCSTQTTNIGVVGTILLPTWYKAGCRSIVSTQSAGVNSVVLNNSYLNWGAGMLNYPAYDINTPSGATISSRGAWAIGEGSTLTAMLGGAGRSYIDYFGSNINRSIGACMVSPTTVYWHSNVVCADDPFYQWVLCDVFIKQFRYYDKIMELDPLGNR